MRKALLSFLTVIMAATVIIAQQVPRDKVVIEIGTATW